MPGNEGAALKLEKPRAFNMTITTRLVDTVTIPMLKRSVVSGRLRPRKLITHEFTLPDFLKGYEIFENAATGKALNVIVRPG